jgi:hypothetical protein
MDARWHVVFASEQDRPDIARLRYWWRRYLGRLDPARLVFVDATWAKTNITRTHGWYRRVLPLRGTIPHAHWRTMTFLAAPRQDGITVPCIIDGSIVGERFTTGIEQFLDSTLNPGDIVTMDNLGSLKGGLIRAASARLLFLPPYSPESQPHRTGVRQAQDLAAEGRGATVEGVCSRIGELLAAFTPAECANYLRNAGYASI